MAKSSENKKYEAKSHILVIDDDERICELVSRFLREHDFVVMTAENPIDAEEVMQRFEFDALVVDVMMPHKSGTEFVTELRARKNDIAILMLTALGEMENRIEGLQTGADDYLSKPFEPMELVLRLQSILRRTKKVQKDSGIYQIGRWRFDTSYDEILDQQDKVVSLTTMEANLLRALAESMEEVVSRDALSDRLGIDAGERTIDVQVTRLRRKIEENTKAPRHLQTIRGKGYMLRAERL